MIKEKKFQAFKAFDADFKCRGFQYEVGATYRHKGDVRACESGFHACENPLDVLAYYDLCDSRFAEVELSGKTDKYGCDSKIAAACITIAAELSLPEFIKRAVGWMVEHCKAGVEAASGDGSNLAASGDGSNLAASGDGSNLAASGYNSKLAASGDGSNLAASGDNSKLAASGYGSKLAASGGYSNLAASGYGSVAMSAGTGSRAKAGSNGAIALAWNDGIRPRIAVGYVGDDGLKADTWYRVFDGKFVEAD